MGQMSNQWEREGHAKKLAVTVMRGAGQMKLTVQFLQRVSGVCQSTDIRKTACLKSAIILTIGKYSVIDLTHRNTNSWFL